ncbi:MAG TPA: signal peptidase II [Tepidisphaeraceae bacterium]|jgi:signal peptidase II
MSSSNSIFRSPAALLRFFGVNAVGLALDLWTKAYAFTHLCDGVERFPDGVVQVIDPREHRFLPGWLHFTATTNQGAVFGLGQGKRWLFIAVSVAAIVFLTSLFARSRRQPWYQIILAMLLAGVLGNMFDRVTLGYVRDMIHALPRWPRLFPYIFNVADCLLCVGVGVMIIHSLFVQPRRISPPADALDSAQPRTHD